MRLTWLGGLDVASVANLRSNDRRSVLADKSQAPDAAGKCPRTDSIGLQFSEPTLWRFDDGEDLGNYNTQQKWLKHRDTLYLVYNRKSELNDGVFRSRAPLFMAEVDPATMRVIRQTERIVFPQNGARMGNFNLVNVSDDEV